MTRPTFLLSRAMAFMCLSSASNISLVRAFSFSGRLRVRIAAPPLFSRRTRSFIVRFLLTIPPAASQRLEKAGSIGIAIGLGLYECELRLVIRLFRVQHRDHADRSQFPLLSSEVEGAVRRALRLAARFQRVGI